MAAPRQFPLNFDDTQKAIEEYKNKYYSKEIQKPSIAGFLGTIGANIDDYMEVIYSPVGTNKALSELLKNFGTWMDGVTIEAFDGKSGSMARFLLSQGFGGYKYNNAVDDGKGNVSITVNFGGKSKDPFG